MKVFSLLFLLVLSIAARANPVALPSLVMTAENVLVKVSPAGISVVGTYRFHVTPDRVPDDNPDRFPVYAWMHLPIPIPKGEKVDEGLMAELDPKLLFNGITIRPNAEPGKFTSMPIVDGVEYFDLLP